MFGAAAVLAASLALAACGKEKEAAAPAPRPVRVVTVEKSEAGTPVSLTGRVEAEDQVNLAFRISGRLLENDLRLGDQVRPGQIVARLESQNELNTLRSAQAALAAAQAQLVQARNHFDRQDTLLKQGWTTRANHDQALKAMQTAQAQVDAAEAQLKTAEDLVSFTELEGGRARRRHRGRPARRRGRAGRADDRHARPQGRPRRRVRRAGAGAPLAPAIAVVTVHLTTIRP